MNNDDLTQPETREAEQTAVPTAYGEAADLNQDGTTTRSETRAYKRTHEDATNDETSGDCDICMRCFRTFPSYFVYGASALDLTSTQLQKGVDSKKIRVEEEETATPSSADAPADASAAASAVIETPPKPQPKVRHTC